MVLLKNLLRFAVKAHTGVYSIFRSQDSAVSKPRGPFGVVVSEKTRKGNPRRGLHQTKSITLIAVIAQWIAIGCVGVEAS